MTRTRRLNSRVISLCLTAAILLTALIGKYLLWSSQSVPTIDEVPEFSGKPYVEINDNKPKFNEKDKKRKAFERYSDLDKLGRCGTAYAKIGNKSRETQRMEVDAIQRIDKRQIFIQQVPFDRISIGRRKCKS